MIDSDNQRTRQNRIHFVKFQVFALVHRALVPKLLSWGQMSS